MSYINEALKKAQELKDSENSGYHGIADASPTKRSRLGVKILLYSLPVLLIVTAVFSIRLLRDESVGKKKVDASNNGPSTVQTGNKSIAVKELYEKALGFYRSGKAAEAKKLYEAALGLDPGYVEALNNLSIIYIQEKDFNAAKNSLEKAVRLNPAYVESYYNLACLCAIKGDIDQGVGYLKKAISLDRGVKEWARNDSDLDSLRRSEAFNKLLSD